MRGAIRDTWGRMGAERSWLSRPISDEYAVAGGQRSDFQGGSLMWTATSGRVDAVAG